MLIPPLGSIERFSCASLRCVASLLCSSTHQERVMHLPLQYLVLGLVSTCAAPFMRAPLGIGLLCIAALCYVGFVACELLDIE